MSVVSQSAGDALKHIKENKKYVFLIYLLQIMFFICLIGLSTFYALLFAQNSATFNDALVRSAESGQPLTPEEQQELLVGADPLSVIGGTQGLIQTTVVVAILYILIHVLLIGSSWAVSYRIVNKKNPIPFPKYITHFLVVDLIAYSVIFTLFFFLLKEMTIATIESQSYSALFYILMISMSVFLYFAHIAVTLIGKHPLKEVILGAVKYGWNYKWRILGSRFIINIILSLPLLLVLGAMYLDPFLGMGVGLIAMIFFIYSRFFILEVMKKSN